MSIQNFIPDVWVNRIEYFRRLATVFEGIVNREYEGTITGVNQIVTVRTPGQITISDYVKDTDIPLEETTGAATEFSVDTEKQWGVGISDVDDVQQKINLLDEYASDAGYRIALLNDDYVLGKYALAGITYGTTASPIDVKSSNVIAFFAHLGRLMSDANLPEENRWLICPPWLVEKLQIAGINIKTNNDALFNNGKIGNILGFELRRSTRTPVVDSTKYKIMGGYGNRAIAFANALTRVKAVDVAQQFKEGLIGMTVYGGKVMRSDNLMCVTITEGSES